MSSHSLSNPSQSDLQATIHIGASSISLLILIPQEDGSFEQVDFLEQSAPIAHDVFSQKKLSRSTIERSVAILDGYRKALEEYDHLNQAFTVRVVATNILSEAANVDIFLNRLHISVGAEVEILDDAEMTRLIYLKTQRRLADIPSMRKRNTLVLHVGPGNTRTILLQNGHITKYQSFRLGTHRTHANINRDSDSANSRSKIRSFIQNSLSSMTDTFAEDNIEYIVLIGYEVQLLRSYIRHQKTKFCNLEALEEISETLASMDDDEIVSSYQVDYQTASVMATAIEINVAIAQAFQPQRIRIPESDYEQGLLQDLNLSPALSGDFTAEVIRSAEKVAQKFQVHMAHAKQVANIAVQLFDQLQSLHKLEPHDGLLLRIAAILHETGLFISTSSHHKHSQYIVQNSEIFGLPKIDVETVALIVRYHHGSVPKSSHSQYKDLSMPDKMRISKLAALIRMADALAASHSANARDIVIRNSRRRIHVHLKNTANAHAERMAMRAKGDLFENIFGLQINLVEDTIS
ncbi:HD domain-containing protein [Rubritalea marina]|uniref:Ppx/GppA phosphatase family protein n=1 Tax=Rubritalea marina TaxID=361055 RepID=UPI00037A9C1E|nr:HD domain-containing protein [Rubritalea marina]